jgi:prepilin-type N-terminal cleavage/methylation domain-containing protein
MNRVRKTEAEMQGQGMRKRTAGRAQHGFSLVELLIVVAIILVLAGIAIPRLLRAKMAASEASAVASLKDVGTANATYFTVYDQGYAGKLAQLGPPPGDGCSSIGSACAGVLDSLLSGVGASTPTPVKSGYRFTYYAPHADPTPTVPNNTYGIVAAPTTPGITGQSSFCF